MHAASLWLMYKFKEKYADRLSKETITVLDIGSRRVKKKHVTYRPMFTRPKYQYVGMDIVPGDNVDIIGYENLKAHDIVISGQVLEHVKQPWEILKIWAGYFIDYICVIAPHCGKEHRHPIDTYRYFPDGMKDLFEWAGIRIVKIYKGELDTMAIGTHY
jgi:hypothetical protein